MTGPSISATGVLLTTAERPVRKSPWPAVHRAQVLSCIFVLLFPLGPLVYVELMLRAPVFVVLIAYAIYLAGIVCSVLLARRAGKIYVNAVANSVSGSEPEDWHIDTDEVRFIAPTFQSTIAWRAFADVDETGDMFHFLMSPGQVFGLPKRCLSEADLGALRDLINDARARGDLKGVPGR